MRSIDYRFYAAAVCTAGAAILLLAIRGAASGSWALPVWWESGLWLGALVLAAVSPVPLPKQRSSVRLGVAVEFAALLVYGPVLAVSLAVAAQVLANSRRLANVRTVLLLGQTAVAIGTAGLFYSAFGGRFGADLALDSDQALVVTLAGAMYLFAHHAVANLASYVESLQLIATKVRPLSHRLSWECLVLPFGVSLAFAHTQVGAAAMVLISVPLFLAWHFHVTWSETKAGYLEAVRSLSATIDAMDPFTRGHAYRVSKMSVAVGKKLRLSSLEIEELEYAALLHDIGRTAIQHEILLKPGELDSEERSVLEIHPAIGRDLLQRIGLLPGATEMVLHHHERPDGRGYPAGLERDAIPLGSQIIMAVAAFDAMTSDRPYRLGLAPEVALDEMLAQAGMQFHSDIVDEFIQLYSSGALFAEFEPHVLEEYARGEYSSRAVSVHLRRNGIKELRPQPSNAKDTIPEIILDESDDRMEPQLDVDLTEVVLSSDGTWMLEVGTQTDTGCVRENNEDSFGVFAHPGSSGRCLLVVADGLGGANAGEVASHIAVQTIRDAYFGEEEIDNAPTVLSESIGVANAVIFARAAEDHRLAGMGTTCVAAAIVGRELVVGHVGDSRAYLISNGEILRLTRDHNLAEEILVAVGGEAPSGAQHVLTRSLGNVADVEVEMSKAISLEAGDSIVLCSDGLSNVVESQEIQEAVDANTPEDACAKLIALARDRGGPDNITVGVARVSRR